MVMGGGRVVGVCRQNICYHVSTIVIPFNLICNMIMFFKKLPFDPDPRIRGWVRRGSGANFRDSFKFDMQHDHVRNKITFDLLTPSQRSGVGGYGGLQEKNICYNAAAVVILLNLICNMTMF